MRRKRLAGPAAILSFAISFALPASVPAAPPDQLGRVRFPTSCAAEVQTTMEKGVALMHSFQYQEAKNAFAEAATQDPKCAMAYWGKAMVLYRQIWDFPQADAMKEGRGYIEQAQKLDADTTREREYIAAAAVFFKDDSKLSHEERVKAYSEAMEKLHAQQPSDVDAGAFYALTFITLAGLQEKGTVTDLKKAIAILEPLFREAPDHPGVAHYLIHATDWPGLAPQGLAAARSYAKIAPDSPHALHMPSHIFSRLGLWQESIDSNSAAAASAKRSIEMHHAAYHYQTHPMDFLTYAYLQSGQEAKARQVAAEFMMVHGASEADRAAVQTYALAQIAIETHRWKEAAALGIPKVELRRQDSAYWARAIGAARSGDAKAARKNAKKLAKVAFARQKYSKKMGYGAYYEKATDVSEAEAWTAFAEGKTDEAVKQMRAAADREDALGGESVSIPAREMLADMLFELKRPAEALAEYRATLAESPNRFDSLLGAGRAAQAAGDVAMAREYFSKLVEISAASADRAELAEAKTSLARK